MRALCRSGGAALVLLLLSAAASAGTFRPAQGRGIPDRYTVVLAEGVAGRPGGPPGGLPDVAKVARGVAAQYGGRVDEVWEDALQGFIVNMPEARAREMAGDARVKSVEQNFLFSAPVGDCYYGTAWQDTRTLPSPTTSPQTLTCTDPDPLNDHGSPTDPPACRDNWGIDRIDQTSASRNNQYSFVNNGTPSHIYMLDTGMLWTHREFLDANGVSRVSGGADARANPAVAGNATNTGDCYGHGTHVAGIAAGRTYGVAKDARIHPVRILDCPNVTSTSSPTPRAA